MREEHDSLYSLGSRAVLVGKMHGQKDPKKASGEGEGEGEGRSGCGTARMGTVAYLSGADLSGSSGTFHIGSRVLSFSCVSFLATTF